MKFTIPIYNIPVVVLYKPTDKELSKYDIELHWEAMTRYTSYNGKAHILMVFTKSPSVGLLAHECLHAVKDVFHTIGHTTSEDHEEETYLLEYLVNEVNKCLK